MPVLDESGNLLAFESGGNTTLRGAVARGEQVIANVGKDLTIESLQDLSTYDSKQKSLGASVSLCIFPFCVGATPVSGSVSASASKVNSDYASVTEQSALRAGGGGFDVKVKNDTDLKGGAITSTQQAIDDNKNAFHTDGTLTLSDIDNKASYSAKSASINIGTGFSAAGALVPQGTSMGFGKDSGSASGTTRAAISGIAGNTNARTGDKEAGMAKIFDAAKVQKEIEAQTRITQMFGQLAPKAAADFAVSRSNVLKDQARQEGDSDKRAALYAEARLWDDGGAYRVALHAAIGGLAGGASGALGAGAVASAAPLLNELQDNIAKGLKDAGASDSVAKIAGQLISGATAAGIGAAVGGSTAGAAAGLNVDANNRQLHPDQIKLIQKMSSDPEKQKQLTVVLCVLQNCDINGLSGYDSSGQALYKTGEQLRSMSPEQFKQLAVEIGNAGLLSGQFAYPLGGLDFTKDAVGKGINDKLNAIEKAYDVAISKPEDLGSAATGAIKGLANNVKDAPQYPLDNNDEKRGAIWANIALVAGPTAVAGVEGGLNALGSAVERRLAPSTVSLETNTAAYTGVIEIVGPYIELGSKDSFVSSRVYKQAFNSQESLVIGSLVDTEVGSQLGMRRLNEQDWTINVNDAWMQGGIDGGKTFYLGSNISIGNLRTGNSLYPKSIFFRELLQLRDANYFRQGELMMPPKKQ
ncbi:hemagglutinin repeat-containing protein [Propionivibrio sp.]|uniref:hemagglutinin repeat-containing protein n=1 Tax=Propionivibrio sp. TaxID=2212460 RepID=UPI0025E6E44A|nr:hemagglutinin repeat-containing protein [Propionivibrio sp.]MBK7355124.1 hemagglutinin repeat-containing protein [Propionivibrio sp.]